MSMRLSMSTRRNVDLNRPVHSLMLRLLGIVSCTLLSVAGTTSVNAAALRAGAAKVDVTDMEAGPVNDPLYVKALVVQSDETTAVILTVDAVAIGEIGPIRNEYLSQVRGRLQQELGIAPEQVLVNASHCHGIVCRDVADRTVAAVKQAWEKREPVRVGVGRGHEDRVMENRRLLLKSGKEADVRHAYALPPDEEVASVGPIDPEIGILRLDRENGQTLAILYNFACHPIQGVPGGGNTADMIGFSSKVLEESFGEGTIALFLQGCGGDINPIRYKDVSQPRDAETLGNLLGLSTMSAAKRIECRDDNRLHVINEVIQLPRSDNAERIEALEARQMQLLQSLRGTSLNLKTFLTLAVRNNISDEYPSYYSHQYLHEKELGRNGLERLDAENRRNMEQYVKNIHIMEELTRLQANLNLLRKHQARNAASGSRTVDAEIVGLRIGEFVLVTFPGELTVRIGMNIKKAAPRDFTFVAGYTNGYLYYAPTAEQLMNVGGAQEDSDCMLAPEWQEIFESKAADLLTRLSP